MLPHFFLRSKDGFLQFPGGHPQNTGAQAGQLHQRVGGCYPDAVVAADFAKEGFDIKDESIQDYFCKRCIRGKAKVNNGRYVLGDWETLVKEFKWDSWTEEEKEDILKNKNRERCIEVGFRYNQYVGFVLRRDDGTVVFLEIIANDYTVIGESGGVDHIAYGLKETYSPLLNVLWDISDFSEEGV